MLFEETLYLRGAVCEKDARTDLRGLYEVTHTSTQSSLSLKPKVFNEKN